MLDIPLKEMSLSQYKEWRKKHSRLYYDRHREEIIKKTYEWQKNNPDKTKPILKKGLKKYNQTPKGIYKQITENARFRRKIKLTVMTKEAFINWYNKQKQECYYCGIIPNGKRLSIDRMDNTKGYDEGNIVLACNDCNKVKSNILSTEEMKIVGQIVMRKRWDK